MKIGFLGNTNNYPFSLARAVRRLGHEVVFLVDSAQPLNRPEFRYSDIHQPYPAWIQDVSPLRFRDCALPSMKVRKAVAELRKCDAVVVNGLGPCAIAGMKIPAVAVLTGSDLEVFGDHATAETPSCKSQPLVDRLKARIRKPLLRRVISRQREGIRNAVAVNYFPKGLIANGDHLLEEIGVTNDRRIFFMMADLDETVFQPPPNNDPLRLFCATRFTWKLPVSRGFVPLDYKGSDVMIRGLSLFRERTALPLQIRFVEKGVHVAEAKQLVKETGLDPCVKWLPQMSQRAVREEFARADIVFEQFGSSMLGMAGLDAMATGRPLIADGRPEILEPAIGHPSPICQARTPEEISAHLIRLLDPAERARAGRESRSYVERYCSPEKAARMLLEALRSASS